MKKVIFLNRLFSPHSGGVEKHTLNLSKELQRKGYQISIVTERHESNLKKNEIIEDIKVFRIPISKNQRLKKITIWKWILQNHQIFLKADVVHAHDVFYWILPLKLLHPSLKVFTTFHGYEGNKLPGFKEKFMHYLARNLSVRTLSVGVFYKKWYNTVSDESTYGAVHQNTYSAKIKKTRTLMTSYIGRLEEEAGIIYYITAFRSLIKKLPVHLDIYGDGSQKGEIQKVILDENLDITLHGWVSSPEKEIATSEIIFTSRYLGILEALADGKYVVASYNNEIKKDYLQNTPFAKYISIASSPGEITKSVLKYLKEKDAMSKKIRDGKKWASSQTWEKLTNQYISLWN